MRRMSICLFLLMMGYTAFSWGFYAHRQINTYAIFLLPPEMMVLFKPNVQFLNEHAVDPDKRRYVVPEEGPRHYIDIDHYGEYPFPSLPRSWDDAVKKYSRDSLVRYGIAPWWIQTMLYRLTNAFQEKNQAKILKFSAELGHYIADAHVPLHACSNHNGQFTGQQGIHGFWESRIPELLAEKEWDFFIGKASYLSDPLQFTWHRVLESAAASDSVLSMEKRLSETFPSDQKFSFENRSGVIVRQYSTDYTIAYNKLMNDMVERRMRQSIYAVACFWYTAWINAGQPDLKNLTTKTFTKEEISEFENLNASWRSATNKICE